MRYLGGKALIAKRVVDVIQAHLPNGYAVWEPFCGGLNVTTELCRRGVSVVATDASVSLISMIQAVRAGWNQPQHLTEYERRAALRGREKSHVERIYLVRGAA